ncbi:hypothetical protein LNP74_15400 [Klebsiella pneumoniae subsp. pneumoniae]|nr:hypothetical protein [Klebsiella pneumoniae subsp. pneumoniae]
MQGSLLKDRPASDNDAPICPIPPGTSADEADNYYSGVAVNWLSMRRWPIFRSG